mmetsp:Transcript_52937/g.133757  ORF Transcript_52937/g.133757 Transcript_52937/m.133757 type:complete len:308 (+) Transcript_52937:56-979(+)
MPPRLIDRGGRVLKKGDHVQVSNDLEMVKSTFENHADLAWNEHSIGPLLGMQGIVMQLDSEDSTVKVKFSVSDKGMGEHRYWFPVCTLYPAGEAPGVATTSSELLVKLFEDDTFKDVTFKLADGETCAHKSVLVVGSSVFSAMFSNAMKEGRTGVVHLSDVSSASMRIFLRLIYTGCVEPKDWQGCQEDGSGSAEELPLDLLLEVTKLGKKYMVANVINDAVEALKARLKKCAPKAETDADMFQIIFSAGIREDLGAVRIAAVEVAKTNSVIHRMYNHESLRPEVQAELQGIWPRPQPAPKRARRLA